MPSPEIHAPLAARPRDAEGSRVRIAASGLGAIPPTSI